MKGLIKQLVLVLPLLAAACTVPEPGMLGTPARDIQVQNSTFRVYVKGDRAEAIRTNAEFGIGDTGIMQRGYIAIQAVSGCDIVPGSIDGDPARMVARLACF